MDPVDAGATGGSSSSAAGGNVLSPSETIASPGGLTRTGSNVTSREDEEDSSNAASSDCKSPGQR